MTPGWIDIFIYVYMYHALLDVHIGTLPRYIRYKSTVHVTVTIDTQP
jgi:hypothetical protein